MHIYSMMIFALFCHNSIMLHLVIESLPFVLQITPFGKYLGFDFLVSNKYRNFVPNMCISAHAIKSEEHKHKFT